jgi:site-specific DNA-methyltransferase (adenine-specific)
MPTHHILINGDSRNMSQIYDESVGLVITSPPYWQLKDYGNERQIGFNQSYEDYINHLNLVWSECYRIMQPGRRLCINIGDQFTRSAYYGRYKVVAIHSEIIRFCETIGFDYLGSIVWQKETNMHPTGGAKVMGSYPYPVNGYVKIDFEHILLFKKPGKVSPSKLQKEQSILTEEEWNTYFKSHWNFCGERQNRHIAVFPEELPKRLIKMFSFVGDTICDPFMGSGTTALAALNQHRNSVGYEINESFRLFYNEKVIYKGMSLGATFDFLKDNTYFDITESLNQLPYLYKDTHRFVKLPKAQEQDYGTKRTFCVAVKNELEEEAKKENHFDNGPMVLVNHVRPELCRKMIEKGICYLRAGDSKGSLLVSSGFERMQYVLLHTGGEDCHLFKLKTKGRFQIWTKETLEEYGFHPEHSPYYVVLQFNNKHEVEFTKQPNLKQRINTYRAKIRPLSDFVDYGDV